MDSKGDQRNFGSRNPDGTWMGGVVRGNRKPFPLGVGEVRGQLTVLRWEPHKSSGGRRLGWHPVCRCTCGWEGFVLRENILKGRSTRCDACAKIKAHTKRYWKYERVCPDEALRARLLNRIASCISRCHNQNNRAYANYGGRGIFVYGPWRTDRIAFLTYLLELPGHDQAHLELDRIDVDKGYEPGNLRFVGRATNVANRRSVRSLQARVTALEAENADLRHRLRRAEEQIHDPVR